MYRAPIDQILSSFIPVFLEKGVPGYEGVGWSVPGEKRLRRTQIRSLLAASAILGALEHLGKKDFDPKRVREILARSLLELKDLTQHEKKVALELVDRFFNFNIIRADHPFDDWVCEALWPQFQRAPYEYPSAMSTVVSYGLTINQTLETCSLEW